MEKYTDCIAILAFLTVVPRLFLQFKFIVFYFDPYLWNRKGHRVQQDRRQYYIFIFVTQLVSEPPPDLLYDMAFSVS